MKLIDEKENKVIFTAKIDESLANAIRKYLNQIPVLAIDEVEIFKNDSPLYDETIAHRLGLVPLKTDSSVSGKKSSQIKLSVKKEGFVNAGEMVGPVDVVYKDIPITFLNKNQELELVATTRLGKGREHAKFSPGLMFYRNVANINIRKECPAEVTEICPQNILKSKDGKVVAEDPLKCDLCDACVELCKKQGKDSIEITPADELMITVESFGQMSAKEIFKKSVEELKKDLKEMSVKVGK